VSATATQVDPSCFGGDDGSIAVTVSGANGAVTYDWDDDSLDGQANPAGLSAGTYTVIVTDASGCTFGPLSITLEAPDLLDLGCVPADVTTAGGSDGQITLVFTGGTAPYAVAWSGPASGSLTAVNSDDILTGLPAGTYTLTLTDANGCTATCSPTLEEPTCNLTATATTTAVSCFGGDDGTATVTPTGGTGPYTITWDDPGFDPQAAAAGIYGYTVSDAVGCTFTGSVTIDQPAILSLDCSAQAVSTVGGNDGVGSLTFSGGTLPLTVAWSDSSGPLGSENNVSGTDYTIGGLAAGTYQVLITDANGCTQTCGFTVNEPGCDLMVTAVAANPTCAGTDDGAIGLVVEGTASPFTFDWNDDALDGQANPQGLAPGNYQVTVGDANGCTEVRNFTLVAPAALQFDCVATDESTIGADDGQVTLTFSGGTPPYALSGDLGTQNNVASPLSFSGLAPGSYEVILTDANGCNQSCTAVVAPAAGCPPIEVTADVTPESCPAAADGAIGVTATGGTEPYSITWTGGAIAGFDPTGLTAGTYFYLLTDANGCEVTGEVTVTTAFAAPTLALDPLPEICYAGCVSLSYTLTGTPPFLLSFNFVTPAGSGSETVPLAGTTGTLELCPADLGLPTLDGVSLELLELTDANCSATLNETLVLPVAAPVTSTVTGTYCPDTTLVIAGETFDRDRTTGQIVLEGASAQGCDSTITVDLTFLPEALPGELTLTLCPGDSAVVHGQVFRAGAPGATIPVPGGTVAGCDSLVNVTVVTEPLAEGVFTAEACPGDTVFVADRAFTVDDPEGVVVLPGASAAGCDSLVSVVVNFVGSEGVVLSGAEAICPGETANLFLSYNGPGTVDVVLVDDNGQTQLVSAVGSSTLVPVTPTTSQRYRIQSVSGGEGLCPLFGTGEATVEVSNLTAQLRESDAGVGISCAGASDGILIAAAENGIGPYSYAWSTGDTTASLTGLSEGTYTVTITDAAGCTAASSATLVAPPPLLLEAVGLAPGCNEERGQIRIDRIAGGTAPYSLRVADGGPIPINAVPFTRTVVPGEYEIALIDANGCRETTSLRVPEGDLDILALPPDTTIRLGDSVLLVGQTSLNPDSIRWTPASGFSRQDGLSIMANPLETTVYRLEVRDNAGCVQRGSVTVFVDRESTLYAPTGFSPNEDGRNDVFRLYSGPSVARIETFQIFNRWGESVYLDGPFDPFDPSWGWDGTHRGQTLNPAVFVYRAVVTLVDGRRVVFQGDVTLLR
jgi:gliding motility-associated-like protein